jgi:GAF domain-containing protein
MNQTRLVEILSELPTALLEDFDLEDVMTALGDDIAEILEVAGAGVMLEDEHGRLRFVVGSDPVLKDLERLQIEFDEGPCLLAYRTGEAVDAQDLASEERFPRFAEAATAVGMGAVWSFPLRYQGDVIGALNLYDTVARPMPDEAVRAGRTLAGVATAYLLNARDITRFRTENRQLARALDRRILVEQAKGYVRAVTDLDAAGAWEVIRRHARSHQVKAEEVARRLLEGELSAEELVGRRLDPA